MITGKEASKRDPLAPIPAVSLTAPYRDSSFSSFVIIITDAHVHASAMERVDRLGGGGDTCGVHDACRVMYAPCAARCVRRVAYTSYTPGGSQSRVSCFVPRSHACVCACVCHGDTNVRDCVQSRASYYARCCYTLPRYEIFFSFRNTRIAAERTRVNYAAGRAYMRIATV